MSQDGREGRRPRHRPPGPATVRSADRCATRARVIDVLGRGVLAARLRIPALDAAFDVGERDRDVAGGLLAGAVAFRLFLWLVPFALAAVTVVGWVGGRRRPVARATWHARFGIVGVAARLRDRRLPAVHDDARWSSS